MITLNEIKAVFFDFGDTLVVLSPTREEMFQEAAKAIGLDLSQRDLSIAYRIVDFHIKYSSVEVKDRRAFYRDYNELLCEVLGISSRFEELHPLLLDTFARKKNWVLVDGAVELLDRLNRRGVLLAIVANWDTNLAEVCERLGIRRFFAGVFPSQACGLEKPDPRFFKFAASNLQLSPNTDRILYVGNEYRADVLGARSAGMFPVLIDRNGAYAHADCQRYTSLDQLAADLELTAANFDND